MTKLGTKPNAAQLRREMGFLTDQELAAFLGIQVPTLKNRRSRGNAPASSKVGRDRLTAIKDALAYVARRKVTR